VGPVRPNCVDSHRKSWLREQLDVHFQPDHWLIFFRMPMTRLMPRQNATNRYNPFDISDGNAVRLVASLRKKYEPVIGLEVHVQCSRRPDFLWCSTQFGAPPTLTSVRYVWDCPALWPVLNKRAVEFAVLASQLLNCQVRETSIFARKNYFYPDLPRATRSRSLISRWPSTYN